MTGAVAPGVIPTHASASHIDIPVMIAVAFACLPIGMTGNRVSRWEGVLFLVHYLAIIVYVALNGMQHRATPDYVTIMKVFGMPLAALTLAVISHRAYKERRQATRP